METGNLADMRAESGKLILDVKDAGSSVIDPGGYDRRFTASIRGWHRGHAVGTGPTREAAIKNLAKATGTTVQDLLSRCVES